MLDRTHLATLAAVLDCGSFDRAADLLGVTPPAVSQRIKALEDQVGTPLVLRGSPCTGTETGMRLARHAADIALLELGLVQDIDAQPGVGRTNVRIAVNADSLATWFLPALTGSPDLSFDLLVDDQDYSADWLTRAEVAAAVTSLAKPVTGCDCHPLGSLRYRAIAAPDFAARHFGAGFTAGAFEAAPAIIFNRKDGLQDRWAAKMAGRRVTLRGHHVPSTHGFVDAARLGMGWGMNPAALVDPLIAAGDLVDLAPDQPLDIALFWQVRRVTSAPLAPLTRAVRRAAALACVI